MDGKHQVLQEYFGYDTFRPGQGELIDALLAGRDAFGVMPTGGGKSLCYQVPALLLPGVTVVVSPLISLMQDQVTALKKARVAAAYLNSALTQAQIDQVCRRLLAGEYRLLYVAPERLLADRFLAVVQRLDIAMVAVDEAHCISQWGQDFRPSYLRIVEFLGRLPRRPVVAAFTATATAQVREDVRRILALRDPMEIVTGFDRPNLRFEVLHPKNKADALLALVRDRGSRCGVVYCSTRKEVENVCRMLQEHGLSATRYHAGLPEEERRENQQDFLYDRKTVMVATNAFGMGIDKSNVGYVLHYNMPQSLEAYYQEAGRAGRDGSDADCILLFSQGDVRTARFLLEHGEDNEALSDQEIERHGGLLQDPPLPAGVHPGLLRPGARGGVRQLRKLLRRHGGAGRDGAGQDGPVLRPAHPKPFGLSPGGGHGHPGAAGQRGQAGEGAGAGQPDHLWPAAGHAPGTGPRADGLSGGAGLPAHRPGLWRRDPDPAGGGRFVPGRAGGHGPAAPAHVPKRQKGGPAGG